MSGEPKKKDKLEEQILLRVPPEIAERIRAILRSSAEGSVEPQAQIHWALINDRTAVFTVGDMKLPATLVDLPCIIETQKSFDGGATLYKTGDIGQMLIVQNPDAKEQPPLKFPHGITPPTQNIRFNKYDRIQPPTAKQVNDTMQILQSILKKEPVYSYEVVEEEVTDDEEEEEEEDVQMTPAPTAAAATPAMSVAAAAAHYGGYYGYYAATPASAQLYAAHGAPAAAAAAPGMETPYREPSRVMGSPTSAMAGAQTPTTFHIPTPRIRTEASEPRPLPEDGVPPIASPPPAPAASPSPYPAAAALPVTPSPAPAAAASPPAFVVPQQPAYQAPTPMVTAPAAPLPSGPPAPSTTAAAPAPQQPQPPQPAALPPAAAAPPVSTSLPSAPAAPAATAPTPAPTPAAPQAVPTTAAPTPAPAAAAPEEDSRTKQLCLELQELSAKIDTQQKELDKIANQILKRKAQAELQALQKRKAEVEEELRKLGVNV